MERMGNKKPGQFNRKAIDITHDTGTRVGSKFKIVAICQIYNEIEKGNLERFLKYVSPLCDDLVVYDDGSTDGSFERVKQVTENVIRGKKNDFLSEINHRSQMLELALKSNPDFILWLDADEVLSSGADVKLQELCAYAHKEKIDALEFHELNIWRSHTWRRIDSLYDDGWFPRLWRVTPKLKLSKTGRGLHQDASLPAFEKKERTSEVSVLHFGFADEKNLAYKYLTYRSHGQRGYKMLDRLISEESLELERLPKDLFPKGLWVENDPNPVALDFEESVAFTERYKENFFRPKYSIACLVYKSVDWLKFAYEQVLKTTDLQDVEFYFVANDANQEVLDYLKDNYIPHYVFNNTASNKKQWYINNVYRAWNYAAEMARGDFIIFINTDMAFSPGWLDELIASYDGTNCVASRLVESGKMPSAKPAISKNFGQKINEFEEEKFLKYASVVREDSLVNGGLFMPLLIRKDHFFAVGGYPEGNVKPGSDYKKPVIAKQGESLISGDVVLMEKLKKIGIKHQTSFNSLAYHFQCGEMDEKTSSENQEKVEIAVANDIAGGSMGEKVLWNYLIEGLPNAYALDYKVTGATHSNFPSKAKKFISKHHPQTKVVIQNASFIKRVDPSRFTIAFLQDDLRSMGRHSIEQELVLKTSNKIVTNSIATSLSYDNFDSAILPIGLDSSLFKQLDKDKLRKKYGYKKSEKMGIFVGNFSPVKGWDEVKKVIEENNDIKWILVTKRQETCDLSNVRVFRRMPQEILAELLNCADFFILGSPVETQCLAALEAGLCNIPLVMHRVGIFKQFSLSDLNKLGIFSDDLGNAVFNIYKKQYHPRRLILKKKLTISDTVDSWKKIVEGSVLEADSRRLREQDRKRSTNISLLKLEMLIRKRIFKKILGREYINFKETFSKDNIIGLGGRFLKQIGLLDWVKKILKI